jgi:type VI protein secretion system component VasF
VRRARKAFEKELVKQGMPKEDAKRMSARYAALKDEALNALKRSIRPFS